MSISKNTWQRLDGAAGSPGLGQPRHAPPSRHAPQPVHGGTVEKTITKIPGVEPSEDLRKRIASEFGGKTILSFSCGKDSIAAWLAVRDSFDVDPYYCYLVPGLEFVEESLSYYEQFFGCKIARLPHPSLYRWINNMTFCPPERCAAIEASSLPSFSRKDLLDGFREWKQLPGALCAVGVRAADSIIRRIHFMRHGTVNTTDGVWYPIWDWTAGKMRDELRRSGVKLPVDYTLFGRSFDGLDYRFLAQIKEYFPRDYARILEMFPLVELELKRKEFANA